MRASVIYVNEFNERIATAGEWNESLANRSRDVVCDSVLQGPCQDEDESGIHSMQQADSFSQILSSHSLSNNSERQTGGRRDTQPHTHTHTHTHAHSGRIECVFLFAFQINLSCTFPSPRFSGLHFFCELPSASVLEATRRDERRKRAKK